MHVALKMSYMVLKQFIDFNLDKLYERFKPSRINTCSVVFDSSVSDLLFLLVMLPVYTISTTDV